MGPTSTLEKPMPDQNVAQALKEPNIPTAPVLSTEQPATPPLGTEPAQAAPSTESAVTGFASSELSNLAVANSEAQASSVASDAIPQAAVAQKDPINEGAYYDTSIRNVNAADQKISGMAADFAQQPGDLWKDRVETKEKGRLARIMAAINPFHKNEPAVPALTSVENVVEKAQLESSTKAPEPVSGMAADFAPTIASAETPPPAASPEPPQPQIPSQPAEMPGYVTDGVVNPPPVDKPELNPLQSGSSAASVPTESTPIAPAPDGSQILKPADSGGSTESGTPTSEAPLADAMLDASASLGQAPEPNLQQPTGTPPATPIIDANLGIPNIPGQSDQSPTAAVASSTQPENFGVSPVDQAGGSVSNVSEAKPSEPGVDLLNNGREAVGMDPKVAEQVGKILDTQHQQTQQIQELHGMVTAGVSTPDNESLATNS